MKKDEKKSELHFQTPKPSKNQDKTTPILFVLLALILLTGGARGQSDRIAMQTESITQYTDVQDHLSNLPAPIKKLLNDMVHIPPGTFMMGCTPGDDECHDEEFPRHEVSIDAFQLSKYEVTQSLWVSVMGSNPSEFSGCDLCPVDNVSWNEVQDFIEKLNQKTGKNYRLPTEAEWEYAARGGDKSKGYKYSGGNNIGSVAWCSYNSNSKTHQVGLKEPNELGLYDMSGNVFEWCSDWYDEEYYKNSPRSNPKGPSTGFIRVLRGGCWTIDEGLCRVSSRFFYMPDDGGDMFGLRLAL